MIRINLLQLQEVAAEVREPVDEAPSTTPGQTTVFLVALAISAAVVAGAYWLLNQRLAGLNQQLEAEKREAASLAAIQAESARYSAELQAINRRIEALQLLQDKRQTPGELLTQLATTVNDAPGLYLISVAPQGGRLSLSGASNSVTSIAALVKDLQLTQGVGDVQLREYYEDDEKDGGTSFRFNLDFAYAGPGVATAVSSGSPTRKQGSQPQQASHGS